MNIKKQLAYAEITYIAVKTVLHSIKIDAWHKACITIYR